LKRIAVFAALAASIMVLPTTSSARTDCTYTTTGAVPVGGTGISVGVQAGPGGTTGAAEAAVGACVDAGSAGANGEPGDAIGFYGGYVEAGAGLTEGVINPGGAGGVGPITGLPGAYGVVDGDDDNTFVSAQGGGYAGVSNFESGTADPTCDGADGGTGSNSGQCLHIRDTVVAIPLVPLACGNTSGKSYHASGRDGCTVP
jgi:hypothetical protein